MKTLIFKNKGFTLVEILIVVAIVAILAALTFPNFSKQMLTTRRTEARTALIDYSLRFEEFYSLNYTYTGADTQYGLNTSPKTENSYYQITARVESSGDSYTLTATAINKQAADTTCATMTINNVGTKTPTACW